MASNNSKSRKEQRRAVARKNFTIDPERTGDKEYIARKEQERKSLVV
jgi:hypothetical protein